MLLDKTQRISTEIRAFLSSYIRKLFVLTHSFLFIENLKKVIMLKDFCFYIMYISMDFSTVENYILSLPQIKQDYSLGLPLKAYAVQPSAFKSVATLFALLREHNGLMHLSLKCDSLLSKILREKYESVFPGHNLPKKYWNTIILSGQLNWQEIKDLIDHSYNFVSQKQK
ncbi:MAG: MmcQ/YjbR family DNA-binding protein [Candidatus Saccharibacteria bacterium]|nr:MmcQ/YjbR family DNA-binding protein [Candidatus Saccharibacteria bacterium]